MSSLDKSQNCHPEVLRRISSFSMTRLDPSEYLRMTSFVCLSNITSHTRSQNDRIRPSNNPVHPRSLFLRGFGLFLFLQRAEVLADGLLRLAADALLID